MPGGAIHGLHASVQERGAERAGCQAAAAEPGDLEFRSNSAIASRQIAARLQVPAL